MIAKCLDVGERGHVITGSKILVVEDHYLLAEDVCEFITDCSMKAIGPANCVESALVYAREADLNGAVLDIDLNGRLCLPVCAMLASRNIPFIFHTGFSDLSSLPPELQSVQKVAKPFGHDELRKALEEMLAGPMDGAPSQAVSADSKRVAASQV
jgi:DNA-binding response OmpR family regulator